MARTWERPQPPDRLLTSAAVEARIRRAAERIADPGLRRMLEVTLPNTLDTTVQLAGDDLRPDAFVITGDIGAMWLRDSTTQLWPYLPSVREDPLLDRVVRGAIARQARQILLDPYANAFRADDRPSEWASDETEMRPGVHERKWEPDSLAAFCRLSAGYARNAQSVRPFDAQWRAALESAIRALVTEQRLGRESSYRFHRPGGGPLDIPAGGGQGAPTRPNGMVHAAFRPSDDACELPLNVPVNLGLAAALDAVAPIATAVGASSSALAALRLASDIRTAVASDGVILVEGDAVWAYEVDGTGGAVFMDDANVPSLLALPYLGACDRGNPLYVATRQRILSRSNPWWFSGRLGDGIGSPHTGHARVWPIAVAMRGLTSTSARERVQAARLLGASHAGTYLAHEAFDVDDAELYSRPWFAWANSMVGEFLELCALDGLLA
jgi:meiotically up-regulated gene 157 (Mug157) protein